MKAVILAGGLGTRISEETTLRPKSMTEVGEAGQLLYQLVRSIDLHYVEVPHPLLPAARVVQSRHGINISFK